MTVDMAGRLRVPATLQRWSAMGYDFATMVHDFKLLVRFFTFKKKSSLAAQATSDFVR